LNSDVVSQHILNLRVGAKLRGIEATVDGWAEKKGEHLVLRVTGSNEVIRLAPLAHVVQWDFEKKHPQAPTPAETAAYKSLGTEVKSGPRRALIVGPLVKGGDASLPMVEVRLFALNP
jgi:hypothetical protein